MWNILIIDDNPYILEALSVELCSYMKDCNILTASDEHEAERILRTAPIDLVLADAEMPGQDDRGLVAWAVKSFPAVRLCAMTGECDPASTKRLADMGIARYIEKPFRLSALASMLKEELMTQQADVNASR